jgi:hypothetical protein
MKYTTFRNLRRGTLAVGCIGLITWCAAAINRNDGQDAHPAAAEQAVANSSAPSAAGEASFAGEEQRPEFGAATLPISAAEQSILDAQHAISLQQTLDSKGENYKLFIKAGAYNLDMRCDFKKGFDYWNRVKVDWNKNKRWDEKWLFGKDGKVKRDIAPADDEQYTMRYVLESKQWILQK